MRTIVSIILFVVGISLPAQAEKSAVWTPDLGNGYYKNPIINADYSDPDVVRAADGYYMTASSFNCVPGLPILYSRDLVNWTIVGHALKELEPKEYFTTPQHGKGVWAPCIKIHDGWFYIYWGDPDFGIYMVKTQNPRGEWSSPCLVKGGKGLIDPSPLWDEDGKVYLAHAWANSRAGVNSVITISEMNKEGSKVVTDEVMVFDGNDGLNHTVEGAKLYKRGGYYYIFAPAGGVVNGWQLAMRSKEIYGPYEAKVVMAQGATAINGPHQGAWVETESGEDWFIHFQDKGVYGRVLHLNPMKWTDDGWCIIGEDKGKGYGEPVTRYKKPNVGQAAVEETNPQETDEFDTRNIGKQWQWEGNKQDYFGMPSGYGFLRMYAFNGEYRNMWDVPNMLLQKFPAEEFTVTTKFKYNTKSEGDCGGLIVMGYDYARLGLCREGHKAILKLQTCVDSHQGTGEKEWHEEEVKLTTHESGAVPLLSTEVWMRVEVKKGGRCTFYYSLNGKKYKKAGTFTAKEGKWIGAKVGMFVVNEKQKNDRGWIDVDWFRVTK